MTVYYAEPDPTAAGGEAYWLEGYAVGDAKFAGMASAATGDTDISGQRIHFAGIAPQATSATDIGGNRLHFVSIVHQGTSATFFGGNRVSSRVLIQEASGAALTGSSRVRFNAAQSQGTATTIIIGRKLWEPEAAPVDLFVDVPPSATTSELWVDVPDAAADQFASTPDAGVSGFVDVPPANENEPNPWTNA